MVTILVFVLRGKENKADSILSFIFFSILLFIINNLSFIILKLLIERFSYFQKVKHLCSNGGIYIYSCLN